MLSSGGIDYARVRAKDPTATIDGYSMLIVVTVDAPIAEVEPNEPPLCQPVRLGSPLILASLSSPSDVDLQAFEVE